MKRIGKSFKRLPYSSREEWLGLRKLGGSDASAILGYNPYRTNLQLWQELVGLRERQNVDNKFTRYGTEVEEHLRGIFIADFKDYDNDSYFLKVSHTNEVLQRIDKPYLTASLDGELEVIQTFKFMSYWKKHFSEDEEIIIPEPIILQEGMKGVLEIKTSDVLSAMHKEKWFNSIPQNYYCQCLHYLNVTNYDFVILMAQLTFKDVHGVMTHETRFYGFLKVGREKELEYLEKQMDKFWHCVETKTEPALKINF